MKRIVLLLGLIPCLAGCLTQSDKHPDMPLLPQVSTSRIQVDSLPNTTVHRFSFSADKTKIYAIVLTASTGVFAEHTLVEFDQLGHRLRQLPLGEMSIQETELALFQQNSLLWQFANVFYVVDLQKFSVIDEVHTYWTGNYPDAQKNKDQAAVAEESRAWFLAKQKKLGLQFDSQKTDSVTSAILKSNKANADAYWAAVGKAREQQTQFESDRHQAYYEVYALKQIQSAKSTLGYRSRGGSEYVFTTFPDGSKIAFTVNKPLIQKAGIRVLKNDINTRVTTDRTDARFNFSEGQSVTDKTGLLRCTERLVTKRSGLLMGAIPEEWLFYYELKLGNETAQFKWILPLALSNDFYLQSANDSAYVVKKGILYWFHL